MLEPKGGVRHQDGDLIAVIAQKLLFPSATGCPIQRVDVDQQGSQARPKHGMRGGRERKGRHDDISTFADSPVGRQLQGKDQSSGRIVNRRTCTDSTKENSYEFVFELRVDRAVVRKPI